MQKILKSIGFLLLTVSLFSSCSSDSSSSNVDTDLLPNKWWYSADGAASDVYFHGDGEYEQTYTNGSGTFESFGNWLWNNEDTGVVRVYDLTGNAVEEYYGKVTQLGAHTMKIKISLDGGETYSDEVYEYQDTNN